MKDQDKANEYAQDFIKSSIFGIILIALLAYDIYCYFSVGHIYVSNKTLMIFPNAQGWHQFTFILLLFFVYLIWGIKAFRRLKNENSKNI